MNKFAQEMAFYSAYHQESTNVWIHVFGVPLITFTAFAGCSDDVIANLEANLTLVGADGTTDQSATIAHVGNGTYTATGSGFVDGFITTGGPVTIDGLTYDAHQAVTAS